MIRVLLCLVVLAAGCAHRVPVAPPSEPPTRVSSPPRCYWPQTGAPCTTGSQMRTAAPTCACTGAV